MREALRVHGATIQHELPQGGEPGLGEEGAWPLIRVSYLDQAAVQHGLHAGGIFG